VCHGSTHSLFANKRRPFYSNADRNKADLGMTLQQVERVSQDGPMNDPTKREDSTGVFH